MRPANRQRLLRGHPTGHVQLSHFARVDGPVPSDSRVGQVLLRVSVVHCAPTVRDSMDAKVSEFTSGTALATPIVVTGSAGVYRRLHSSAPRMRHRS